MVFLDGETVQTESDAALHALAELEGLWRLALIFKILPRLLRNKIYQSIAVNRYRWFGKKESCRLPTADEKDYFLP